MRIEPKNSSTPAYQQLVYAETIGAHTIEIEEISTGLTGVANTCKDGRVYIFYGNPDGSDDKAISPEEFSADFKITAVICEEASYWAELDELLG